MLGRHNSYKHLGLALKSQCHNGIQAKQPVRRNRTIIIVRFPAPPVMIEGGLSHLHQEFSGHELCFTASENGYIMFAVTLKGALSKKHWIYFRLSSEF